MTFQLAITGRLPDEPVIARRVDELMGALNAYLCEQGPQVEIQLLVSPSYTGGRWLEHMGPSGYALCGYALRDSADRLPGCARMVQVDSLVRSVIGEAVCDRADLLLAVWNEDVLEFEGASWELIQLAHQRRTPCLWLSSKTGRLYWPQSAYYEPYAPERLRQLCQMFCQEGIEPEYGGGEGIPLLSLGMSLHRRYLKKYAAEATGEAGADRMLEDGFSMEEEHPEGAGVRAAILTQFRRFDQAAIEFNGRYQAVIYWRAILPFVASVFIAIGFYAETLLGVFPLPKTLLTVVAGVGFLIHGLLNLYVYVLSRNAAIRRWHQNFVESRYIAEILRVLIHFVPFGVGVNLRRLCGSHQNAYATVRRIIGEGEPAAQKVDRRGVTAMLAHTRELLTAQIAYHTASVQRYSGIVEQLDKWGRWSFGLGFTVTLLRALLQFSLIFISPQGSINGVALTSLIRSGANMLALMLPAWAAYFASKASLCSFRYNYENHRRMAGLLSGLLDRLSALESMEQDIPIEALSTLAEEIAEIMLIEDASPWRDQHMGAAVKHM